MSVNANSSEDSDDNNEYEEMRKKCRLAKLELFRQMGVPIMLKGERPGTSQQVRNNRSFVRRERRKSHPIVPVRKSARLCKISDENISPKVSRSKLKKDPEVSDVPEVPTQREFFMGPEPMIPVSDYWEEDVKPSLQDLIPYLSNGLHDGTRKSLDEFKTSLKSYSLSAEDVKKVGTTKTFSLLIHPSESKLLIITGDAAGYLSFWDVDNTSAAVEIYKPHRNPIFCISLCSYNPSKLYATAIDGIVRSCDLEKMEFNDVYVVESQDHTVYHTQMSPHVLLVAHGCGSVGLVDIRESKKPSKWIECHTESVRTVQQHPSNVYEFVTSSRVREAGIWDIRNAKKQKPLLLYPHPKGLKSAFYSPGGSMLLTSCNDDVIRIYAANKNHLIMSRSHNMQTGRWLRPFMATWHPRRDDVFIVGSLSKPREVDIYGIHGLPLHSLKSPNLNTVLSNCHFHKSLPVIAGANNSGYVHVFRGSV